MTDTSARAPARAPAQATRDGLTLGLAVGTSGLAFGAAAVASGLSVAQACVLSLVGYTGASQFALAGVVAAGGNLAAGTAGAVPLGSRNGLYGLRLAGLLRARGAVRLLAALAITDEFDRGGGGPAHAGGGPRRVPGRLRQPLPDLERGHPGGRGRRRPARLPRRLRPGCGGPGRVPGLAVADAVRRSAVPGIRGRGGARRRRVPAERRMGGAFRGVAPRAGTALGGAVIAVAATPFCPPGIPVILAAAAALVAVLPWPRAMRPAGRAWRRPAWRRSR